MSGQELINWIKLHNAEDAVVEVAYRDDGGLYYGTDKNIDPFIVDENVSLQYIGKAEYKRLIL